MGEKSGETKKTTDFWGNEKEVHFDSSGNKTGETKFTTDFWGSQKQEHFDTNGNKTGETRKGSDLFGNERAEHFDRDGRKIGHSENGRDVWGDHVQRHYDESGSHVGTTHRSTSFLGGGKKVHEGDFFKAPTTSQRYSGSSGGYTGSYGGSSCEGSYSSTKSKGSSAWKIFLGILIACSLIYGIAYGINSQHQNGNSKPNSMPKIENKLPLDSSLLGTLSGYALISPGDPIIISSFNSDGTLKWKRELKHGQGLMPKRMAAIDYDKDGFYDELLVEISGSTTPPNVITFGPEAYIFNFLILDNNGNTKENYQCGYLTSPPMAGVSLSCPRCTEEEADVFYQDKLQQYGYRDGNGFLERTY